LRLRRHALHQSNDEDDDQNETESANDNDNNSDPDQALPKKKEQLSSDQQTHINPLRLLADPTTPQPITYLPLPSSWRFPINPYIRLSTWQDNNTPPPPGVRAMTAEQLLAEYRTADHSIPAHWTNCIDAYSLDEYLETAIESVPVSLAAVVEDIRAPLMDDYLCNL